MPDLQWLDWPAPSNVKACYTLRTGGVSGPPYQSFNLGSHVGDCYDHVVKNRQRLYESICQKDITWLTQVHGVDVVELPLAKGASIDADASVSCTVNQVCCVMTADCLPVFFCDELSPHKATTVAVAHAGWRGLLNGVLQKTLEKFAHSQTVIAYLGPAISQQAFEVGDEVRTAFVENDADVLDFFTPSSRPSKWMADLYGIARVFLQRAGVCQIYGGDRCTYREQEYFFSYRRDGVTGRMANLIWLEPTVSKAT